MEICNLCHQPMYADELIKDYQVNAFITKAAHLDCYKRYVKIMWIFYPLELIFGLGGAILTALGAVGLDGTEDWTHSTSIVMLVIGIIALVIMLISITVMLIKYYDIRKNPGEHPRIDDYEDGNK